MLRICAVSCIVAALAQALAVGAAPIAVIGASGGVYGLLGAAVPFLLSGDVASGRRNALTFVGVVMGLNLLTGLAGMAILGEGAGLAWQAHHGGFFAGLLARRLVGRWPYLHGARPLRLPPGRALNQ